ncbi:General transcription factor IIF subunit 1 [Chelonia mydas]|uniref:Transcription initiation factor IIF subunit alpha n=1 Tax=Chelonia mydas TaxID=8469 RepID=M7BN73_CHEMY|nr:General transcription factor IIF subunit 1 [Chelonia mydas]
MRTRCAAGTRCHVHTPFPGTDGHTRCHSTCIHPYHGGTRELGLHPPEEGTSSQSVTEYVVRVPKNTPKKYNIMAFNAADKVNFTTWHQAKMERDLSNKKIYQEEEMPESGAGSEFNRKLREEARRKKYGIVLREFKPEDQPWILKVNGKAGRKFKGVKKGGVTENASYYIFTQCPDGAFEAFPVSNWYNFTPVAKHRTLTAEEAEEEWERRNKVLNHFTIMQQRRLKDQDDEEEEKEKKTKKKSSELKIHDLEDDLEMSSDESELSDADGEKAAKPQKKTPLTKKKKKKKKGSDDEAFEDSDDGDFEGQEVDYMSDGSSSSQEEATVGKPKVTKEEDGPKGIDEASESSEESEEEKPAEEKEEEEEEKKAPTPQEKKKKKDSSDESETSEESDIDSEASSALFMAKRKTPPKKERKGSASSSRGDSRPGTPPVDPGSTSSTLRAAASKLEQDVQLTEEAVRRYLTRKPMTTKDLLKKFQTKKTGLSSEQTVNVLAQILKRLNPERKMINDKMHFFLKE